MGLRVGACSLSWLAGPCLLAGSWSCSSRALSSKMVGMPGLGVSFVSCSFSALATISSFTITTSTPTSNSSSSNSPSSRFSGGVNPFAALVGTVSASLPVPLSLSAFETKVSMSLGLVKSSNSPNIDSMTGSSDRGGLRVSGREGVAGDAGVMLGYVLTGKDTTEG